MKQFIVVIICFFSSPLFGGGGHVVLSPTTDDINVAVLVEPWPLRIGNTQWQVIVTDQNGDVFQDARLQVTLHHKVADLGIPFITFTELQGLTDVEMFYEGDCQVRVVHDNTLLGEKTCLVLGAISPFWTLWQVWIFLILGLLAIILREILARRHARRYP